MWSGVCGEGPGDSDAPGLQGKTLGKRRWGARVYLGGLTKSFRPLPAPGSVLPLP